MASSIASSNLSTFSVADGIVQKSARQQTLRGAAKPTCRAAPLRAVSGRSSARASVTSGANWGGQIKAASLRNRHIAKAASEDEPAAEAEAAEVEVVESSGVAIVPAVISIAVGLVTKFLVPCPATLTAQAWSLLAIFLSTVTGLVLKPLPVGAWAFLSVTFTILTGTLSFGNAFAALTNEVIWLIVVATFFARAFVKTGFGDRLALFFVKLFGKNTLSLAYGLQAAEMAICPAMPSTTARAGGVFVPIINSLDKRTRSYLIAQQLQGGNNTSSILLTAAAQNFLCIKLAEELGVVFTNPFNQWFMAASVPCLLAIAATPYIMYLVDPPEVKDTPEAPIKAAEMLKAKGGLTSLETKMIAGLGVTVALWVFGAQLGVSAVLAAMIGMSILLTTGVLTWNDALEESGAWDTLFWFAILIGMSAQLNALGVVSWLSASVSSILTAANLGWMSAFACLHLGYYMLHYLFASQTAHVGALFGAFLGMMLAAGVPGTLAALTLAFNTNLFGGMTHFASGQSAVYFGAGYIELSTLWKQGAYMGVVNFLIWGIAGMAWWKVIGLW